MAGPDSATLNVVKQVERTTDDVTILESSLPNVAAKSIASANPIPSGSPSASGMVYVTLGTDNFVNPSNTSLFTALKRVEGERLAASTTNFAGWRANQAYLWLGNAAGLGGFKAVFRFGPSTGQAVAGRMFTGLSDLVNGGDSDVEPSSLNYNIVGVGYDAADGDLYIIHRTAGAGASTKIDTGLVRSNADRSKVYTLTIECEANASSIDVTIVDEIAGTSFSTTLTTNLPANNVFMTPRSWCSVGGVSSVIGMAFFGYYSET